MAFQIQISSTVVCSDYVRVDSSVDLNEHPLISTKKLLTLKLIAFLVVFFFKIFGESFLSLLQQAEKCLLFFLNYKLKISLMKKKN